MHHDDIAPLVLLRHRPTGGYLGDGLTLVDDPAAALWLCSAEVASLLRWACDPQAFVVEDPPFTRRVA